MTLPARTKWFCLALPGLLLMIIAARANAEVAVSDEVDWSNVILHLFGGLALFLAGLDLLSEGLKKLAGESLRIGLSKLTGNRFMAAITGAFVTAVINSSSVTTVLVVGFVTAGVMTLAQAVGVIMGANIGSTMTAQLLAFNLSELALFAIAAGFFMTFTGKQEKTKQWGSMIMGLGLVFYGMGVMSDGMKPLRSYEPFIDLLRSMEQPVFGILLGAAFTALVQSSAATVGIAIAMASEGLLTLPAGISLALGANIGTCATALLAAIGKPVAAVRTAWVHVMFNVAGVLLWLPFIDQLATLATQISPGSDALSGAERMAAEVPRQIANANTIFNIINTALFIGFTGVFAKLAVRLIPDRPERKDVIIEPLYLDKGALSVPSVAMEGVRTEMARSGEITLEMLRDIREVFREEDLDLLDPLKQKRSQVLVLRSAILNYLARTGENTLTEKQAATHRRLMAAVMDLSSIAEIIAGTLSELAVKSVEVRPETSETTREILGQLYAAVYLSVEQALIAVTQSDATAALQVIDSKQQVADLSDALIHRKWQRMPTRKADYATVVELEISLVDRMRQIYTLAKRIAKTMLPEDLPNPDDE